MGVGTTLTYVFFVGSAVEMDKTHIVIDDDIEIVGTKEAEVMSHIRADCPIHKFQ